MTAGLEKRKMAAFSGRLGKNWLGVWARVRQHGEKRRVGCVRLARFCLPEMDTRDWLDKVGEHICAGIFARLSFQRKVD